jgi:hypothetical protein
MFVAVCDQKCSVVEKFGKHCRRHVHRVMNMILASHVYVCTRPSWTLAPFSVSYSYTQSVGFFLWGISPSQGANYTQNKPGINAHRHTCLEGDSNPRSQGPSACLRPRGHCDRLITVQYGENKNTYVYSVLVQVSGGRD